jgi:hypothetical protein
MHMRIGSLKMGVGDLGTGLVIGAGVAFITPFVIPVVGGVLKAVTKGVIKTGLLAYEGGRGLVNNTTAAIEDITAEAKSEIKNDSAAAPKKTKPKPARTTRKAKPQSAKKAEA